MAVAAVAVTMLVLASADARRYHDSENTLNMAMTSSLSRAELSGLASSANLKYSVALGTGIGAVVLGAVAGFLFARGP